ncbi:MAG: hypothetical protein V1646_01640 [bacterium]
MKISRLKTSRFLAFIIFCALSASISFFIKKSQLKADVFEDLFKDVDFEQLAKDMEKMLGDAEDKADLPKMTPVPATDTTPGVSGSTEKATESKTSWPKKDRRTLFLNPDMKTIETKNKKITEPTQESRTALSSFVQEMDKNLKIFEKNIVSNKKLSPQFKEKYLYEIRKKIDEIVVASELIDSKKVYQKIFLTPPTTTSSARVSMRDFSEDSDDSELSDTATPKSFSGFGKQTQGDMRLQDSMKQLRQRYLALIDGLNTLNKKLEVTEEEESKEDKTVLEELAGAQTESLPGYTPLVPLKPKVRGAKPKTSIAPKKSDTAKKIQTSKGIKLKASDIESQARAEVQTGVQR